MDLVVAGERLWDLLAARLGRVIRGVVERSKSIMFGSEITRLGIVRGVDGYRTRRYRFQRTSITA
jgi:hypothetical protein